MQNMHNMMQNMHVIMQKYAQLCTLCTHIRFKLTARTRTQVIAGQSLAAIADR